MLKSCRPEALDHNVDEKAKRLRTSPPVDMPSPAPSNSTIGSKNPPTHSAVTAPPPTKGKRSRKVDDSDESCESGHRESQRHSNLQLLTTSLVRNCTTVRSKALNAFSNKGSASSHQGPSHGTSHKRGSPAKRGREDGRKAKAQEREMTPLDGGGWGLPDHLGYLSYLLPTPAPAPITVSTIRQDISVPGSATFPPEDMMMRTPKKEPGSGTSGPALGTVLEPATRVKFPGKRVTIADLRKRSKHLVDYLQKVQIETSEREKRSELINKSVDGPQEKKKRAEEVGEDDEEEDGEGRFSITAPVVSAKTLEIMDDLTRELYHWQEKYKQN